MKLIELKRNCLEIKHLQTDQTTDSELKKVHIFDKQVKTEKNLADKFWYDIM